MYNRKDRTIPSRDTGSGSRCAYALLATALALASAFPAAADQILGTPGATITLTEGSAGTNLLVATFISDNSALTEGDFNAIVHWGDGNSTTALVTKSGGPGFDVTASYTYADEGTFSPTVDITSNDVGSATVPDEANIADAPLTNGSLSPGALTEGTAFNGLLASFSDGNLGATPSDFNASIDWGDGFATAGVITGSGGAFNISALHTYSEAGVFPVIIDVSDTGSSLLTITGNATVSDALLSGNGLTITPTAGTSFNGAVANLNDGNLLSSPSDFNATINWGDGNVTTGTVTGSGGAFQILGAYTYLSSGPFNTSIQVNDIGGSTDTLTGSADVASPAAPAPEPAAWLLAAAGVTGLFLRRRRAA